MFAQCCQGLQPHLGLIQVNFMTQQLCSVFQERHALHPKTQTQQWINTQMFNSPPHLEAENSYILSPSTTSF